MHIGGGLSRLRAGVRTVHLAQILASHPDGGAMTFLGLPHGARAASATCAATEPFPAAARLALADSQLRAQPGHGHRDHPGQARRGRGRVPRLGAAARRPARRSRRATMAGLDGYLEQLEAQVTARGGMVHWARDADRGEPHRRRAGAATGATEVVKVKSMATEEIGLNEALGRPRHRRRSRPTWPS